MINYLSVDVESWASPNLPEFIKLSSKEKKDLDRGHIKNSTLKILKILKKHKVKLTFFIVGQLYAWYPEVVEKIAKEGHEIAYHTHAHDVLYDSNMLIKSMEKSRKFLQRFRPIGFRAPRIFKNTDHSKLLKKYGFKYDSSSYGNYSKKKKTNGILEIPVTSIWNMPIGSGYFMGLLGKRIDFFYQVLNKKNAPMISFIHNWQVLRPENPTFPSRWYVASHPLYMPYLANCDSSFEHLIKNYRFGFMKNLVE